MGEIKEVKSKRSKKNKSFYLSIFNLIKEGKRPSKISKELNITKQRLQYYLSSLKKKGYIKKVGYGTWEILKELNKKEVKEVKKSGGVASTLPDNVRGHGFEFKLLIPENYRNWDKREEIFDYMGLKYKEHFIGNQKRGQRLKIDNISVHLFQRSIIIRLKQDFITKTAKNAKSYALAECLKVIKKLERMFNNSPLSNYGKYKIKVTRQHYALVKNALARQYINEKKKLNCYTGKGLWLLIDDSFNLEELETIHPETAVEDNEKVQNFFNGLKETEEYTPKFVVKSIAQNTKNLNDYAVHLKSHVESVQKLGSAVEELTKIIREMKK